MPVTSGGTLVPENPADSGSPPLKERITMIETITLDRLRTIGLTAFGDEILDQQQNPDCLPVFRVP